MTSESKSQTEPWVEKKGASYPYAYDKGGKLARFFGVRGIPHAILVDPSGRVAWRGHPASLDGEVIEANLAGALVRPLYSWPSSAKAAAQALVKGDFAKALEKAAKVPEADGGAAIVEEINGVISSRLAALDATLAEGNFFDALETAEALVKGLKGLPGQARAERVAADVENHPRSKDVIAAQKKIRKVRSKDPSKRREIDSAIDDMKEIVAELRGTYAAEEASAYLEELERLKRK